VGEVIRETKIQEPKNQDPKKKYKLIKEYKKRFQRAFFIRTPFGIYNLNILWFLDLGFLDFSSYRNQ